MIPITLVRGVTGLPPDQDAKNKSLRSLAISLWEKEVAGLWNRREGEIIIRRPGSRDASLFLYGVNFDLLEVKEWNTSEADGTVLTTPKDYSVLERGARMIISPVDHWWALFVKITVDCGYEVLPDEFGDVTEALLSQISFMMNRYQKDRVAQDSVSFEGGTTRFVSGSKSSLFDAVAKKYGKRF